MDVEAQILYDNSVRSFNKMNSAEQVKMLVHIKGQLKSHYDGVERIGLGMAKSFVEAGEQFITDFGYITKFTQEMLDWIDDGNVIKSGQDSYIEQTTQWKKKFTQDELIEFFNKEYLVD